jgi:hypothetical protein
MTWERSSAATTVRRRGNQELPEFNEDRTGESLIRESIAGFFRFEYLNRGNLFWIQFASVIQDWRSSKTVGHLNRWWFVIELNRKASSGSGRFAMFNELYCWFWLRTSWGGPLLSAGDRYDRNDANA